MDHLRTGNTWHVAANTELEFGSALKALLAAPSTQEPAAWMHEWTSPATGKREREARTHKPQEYELTPGDTVRPLAYGDLAPAREAQMLTDEESLAAYSVPWPDDAPVPRWLDRINAVQAAFAAKNGIAIKAANAGEQGADHD